jgi:hypothetical protein
MEPECLLPCSQRPTTGPYPRPDESCPRLILFRCLLPFIIIIIIIIIIISFFVF